MILFIPKNKWMQSFDVYFEVLFPLELILKS